MNESLHPILLLAPDELIKIETWIEQNGYSLDHGHFELVYEFWLHQPGLRIHWKPSSGGYGTFLELREGCGDDNATLSLPTLKICGHQVPLILPKELRQAWLDEASALTEAEVNMDCLPSGSSLFLKIHRDGAQVLIGNHWTNIGGR